MPPDMPMPGGAGPGGPPGGGAGMPPMPGGMPGAGANPALALAQLLRKTKPKGKKKHTKSKGKK